MKKWLLAGLLIGSFAFGKTITVKKGSYCTGFTDIGVILEVVQENISDFIKAVILMVLNIRMLH